MSLVVDPKSAIKGLSAYTEGNNRKCIAYKSSSDDALANGITNLYFEDVLNEVYSYIKSHLVKESFQIDVLRSIAAERCVENVYPDIKPDLEQDLEYYTYNIYKANVPRNDTGSINFNEIPKLRGKIAASLHLQDLIVINLQKEFLSAMFTNALFTSGNSGEIKEDTTYSNDFLSNSLLCTHLFDVFDSTRENNAANYSSDKILIAKPEISAALMLNTIQTFESNYSSKKPTIILSNYVLNRLKELIRTLSNVRIFNYNAYFKKTAYSGKIYYKQFLTTAEALYKYNTRLDQWQLATGLQYIKENFLISPYMRQFNEDNSGVFVLYNEDDDYHLQLTSNESDILLKDNIRFIYTTDETSDIPTFDFSTQFGSNGNFTFYKTILTEKSNLEELIDLSMFNIANGEQIYALDIVQAIYYIFRVWIENIKTYYYSLFICHSNCHNNSVLEDTSDTTYTNNIVYIQCPEYGPYAKTIFLAYSSDNPGFFSASIIDYNKHSTSDGSYKIYGTLKTPLRFKTSKVKFFTCKKIYIFRSSSFPAMPLYDALVLNALPSNKIDKSALLADTAKAFRYRKYLSTITAAMSRGFSARAVEYFGTSMYQVDLSSDGNSLTAEVGSPDLYLNSTTEANNNELTSAMNRRKYLYCLNNLDTMYVKFGFEPTKYKYKINYYNGNNTNNCLLSINRLFTITDNNDHIYYYSFAAYSDGQYTRPCIVVSVSDIDKNCRYNINSILIIINNVVAFNYTIDKIISNEYNNCMFIRKYSNIYHDLTRIWTEWGYKLNRYATTETVPYYQLYYTLLDAYSFDSPFYKCSILNQAVRSGVLQGGIIPDTISNAHCATNNPATKKYAILPINIYDNIIYNNNGDLLPDISYNEDCTIVVNVYCS